MLHVLAIAAVAVRLRNVLDVIAEFHPIVVFDVFNEFRSCQWICKTECVELADTDCLVSPVPYWKYHAIVTTNKQVTCG